MLVTEKRQLTVTGYMGEGDFELSVKVGTHVIDLVLDYPGRSLPKIVSPINAVLLIDLAFIADSYESILTIEGLIPKAISDLVSIDVEYNRWLFSSS